MKSLEISPEAMHSSLTSRKDDATTHSRHVVHVTSSRFYGGPERQMLELARELRPEVTSTFVSFSEGGLCRDFLEKVREAGFRGIELENDTPHLVAAARELAAVLKEHRATVACVHGYKAGLLGLWASRKSKVPIIAVSRGWTGESWKVRLYEKLDRLALRRMDRVVCVSHGQAEKVRRGGVDEEKIAVVHNAIRLERFQAAPDHDYLKLLCSFFGRRPTYIIGAAGRLSPEKGFDVLVDAAALMASQGKVDFGIVLFGDGSLRGDLTRRIDEKGMGSRLILAGFTDSLDSYMPHFDAFVQSSHTEGLPNVILEAAAAGVPVVATNVGGTAEVVIDGETGLLVPPGDVVALERGLTCLLREQQLRAAFRQAARQRVLKNFTFAAQAESYNRLFRSLLRAPERIT